MSWSDNIKQLLPGHQVSAPPLIDGDLQMQGNFFFTGSGGLDGQLKGIFSSRYDLEIRSTAKLTGPVTAHSLKIEGIVEGDLKADDKLHGLSGGMARGNVQAGSLLAEPGFDFEGGLHIGSA